MFAAIYRWRVTPGREDDFRRGWLLTSRTVREEFGSLGSRLHVAGDGLFVSYGRWAQREDREAYRAHLDINPEGFGLMRDSVDRELPVIDMHIVGDLLVDADRQITGLVDDDRDGHR